MRTVLLTVAILSLFTNFAQASKCCKAPKRKKCYCCCVPMQCPPATTARPSTPQAAAYDDSTIPPAPATDAAKAQ